MFSGIEITVGATIGIARGVKTAIDILGDVDMEQATPHRRHGTHSRKDKMLYYDLQLHSSGSALEMRPRKTLRLMEVRPGARQGMITEIVITADDTGIHALHGHGHHGPGNQHAGAPGWLPLQAWLEGQTRDKRFVGMATLTRRGKIEDQEVPCGAEFDFEIGLSTGDEAFHDIILPQVRHPRTR
jgi:hypothetical protein